MPGGGLPQDRGLRLRRTDGVGDGPAVEGSCLHLPRLPAHLGQRLQLHGVLWGDGDVDPRRIPRLAPDRQLGPLDGIPLLPGMRQQHVLPDGGISGSRRVAVGCFADPGFDKPATAYWTTRRHLWFVAPPDLEVVETQ